MLIKEHNIVMQYLTTAEIACRWGVSQRRASLLCSEGRVEGAVLEGKTWLIPENARKPFDARTKKNGEEAGACSCDCVSESKPAHNSRPIYVDGELATAAYAVCGETGSNLETLINRFLKNLVEAGGNLCIGLAKGFLGNTDDIDFCNEEIMKQFGV